MENSNNDDNSKKFQEDLDRVRRCLDEVKRKQDDFGVRQNEMAGDIIVIKNMMSQFMGGANPPFNPLEIQSPKILEGESFSNHEIPSMHAHTINFVSKGMGEWKLQNTRWS